ncbi:MAG: hypothetical protein ACF8SC_04575 [Phycisphaerales bacterium JB037]
MATWMQQEDDRYIWLEAGESETFASVLDRFDAWLAPDTDAFHHKRQGVILWLPPPDWMCDRSCLSPVAEAADWPDALPTGLLFAMCHSTNIDDLHCITVVPATSLEDPAVIKFLAAHGEAVLRRYKTLSERVREIEAILAKYLSDDHTSHDETPRPPPAEGFSRWPGPMPRGAPDRLWSVRHPDDALEPHVIISLLGEHTWFRHLESTQQRMRPLVHSTNVVADWVDTHCHNAVAVLERAEGTGARTEDDKFPDPLHLLRSGRWLPSDVPDPLPPDFTPWGFSILPLRHIASSIEEVSRDADIATAPDVLYIRCSGPGAPSAFLADQKASTHNSRLHDPKDRLDGQLPELLRIVAPSPDTLCALLNDDRIQYYLRAQAYGSFLEPRIPRSLVESIEIPWPSPAHRQNAAKGINEMRAIVSNLTHELNESLSRFEALSDRYERPYTDWGLDALSSPTVLKKLLAQELTDIATRAGLPHQESHFSDTSAGEPPYPLAIHDHQLASHPRPVERLWILLDLAEQILKFDAILCLSIGLLRDARVAHSCFRKINMPRTRLNMSMGHWGIIGWAAHSALGPDGSHEHLPAITRSQWKSAYSLLESITQLRNETRGHGVKPRDGRAEMLCEDIQNKITKARSMLPYLDSLALVATTGRTQLRYGQVRLSRIALNGSNDRFAVQEVIRPDDHPQTRAIDGDVYAVIDDSVVALYPWIVLGPGKDPGRERLWIFDGLDRKKGTASLVDVTGEESKRDSLEVGDRIAELLGL